MDVDNDNFYDEIASFMPQPGDYSLDDLDEIIRSTDSHLDASFDLNAFPKPLGDGHQNEDYDMGAGVAMAMDPLPHMMTSTTTSAVSADNPAPSDFHFDFSAFPSPATSQQSSGDYVSPFDTPVRTSSTSSVDGDYFNPDDFINFLNDDDAKFEDLTQDTIRKLNQHNERNTPSPTGSCSSSSGSSTTSGVQSDSSSLFSVPRNGSEHHSTAASPEHEHQDDLSEFIRFKNEKSENSNGFEGDEEMKTTTVNEDDNTFVAPPTPVVAAAPATTAVTLATNPPTLIPVTLPVVPVATLQPVNIVPGTIMPVQSSAATLPVNKLTPVVNIKAPVVKPPVAVALQNPAQTVKVINAPAPAAKVTTTPPTNPKPKTIFLSSNDFKALMQKVNTTNGGGVKKSGTPPKIIMKTASGKFITANKLGQATTSVTTSQQPKTSATISLPNGVKLAKNNSRADLHSSLRDFSGASDDKILKKQLRMLKNRESASLSRKKKKEYVERLENRIHNLEKENYSLKGENTSLRSQLMAFAQSCNCKNRNVSEFILKTLNINATSSSMRHHVKIAPKPLNANNSTSFKGFKHRMNAATVKKNVAVLFAMAFMVTLNVGNFQNYLNKTTALENAMEASAATAAAANEAESPLVAPTGRRLLWVPNEHEFMEQTNRSKREAANIPPPPPLHFLRPVNRTATTTGRLNGTTTKDEPPIKGVEFGPTTAYGNMTNCAQENMRLARNLHKWIGDNGYLNMTGDDNGLMDSNNVNGQFNFDTDYDMDYDVGVKQKRKIYLNNGEEEHLTMSAASAKQKKYDMATDEHNSLDIFKPRISEEYLRLFRGIKRQDDTFYVLSFNMDHLLLPAYSYNKSARPKMALMLPAGDPSINGDIVLMQIDCEVMNTTELKIKSHMIPEKLRPVKYGPNVRVHPNDVANNETKNNDAKATTTKPSSGGEIHLKREEDKVVVVEKPSPSVKVYNMMGPKNHINTASPSSIPTATVKPLAVDTASFKRRPLKFNANDSVIGSGVLNVRNSTLFTRMKETVINGASNGFIPSAASEVRKLI
ncbi:uncharacterized protein LOC133334052 [Musca vetustissima]|uniref:uncharacterized protein LOC133334052 n=1 Tax=Musca vetustissima TaxID=27455 RepID=UPI002AB7DB05|nr:uncharacterized protein LOC133334052 [Musca vetustissima]